MNVGFVIEQLLKERTNQKLSKTSSSHDLLNALKLCGGDLSEIYSVLSMEIHGAPWSGPAVKLYSSKMSKEANCVLQFIVSKMLLPVEEI